jgi:hypothetical protein
LSTERSRSITRVTVPSKWGGEFDTEKTGRAEFRLGDGPCGRHVTNLRVTWSSNPDRIVVRQRYREGDTKDFIYLVRDITGRVQVTQGDDK